MKIYDTIVIGGGPAGLSAAIYTARFLRSTLIIDKHDGRWNTYERNRNYLGFPDGILARTLREKGLQQAQEFGAEYLIEEVTEVKKIDDYFAVKVFDTEKFARTLIFATGVVDNFPHFEKWQQCVGKSLFWCITCDGFETRGQKLMVLGTTNEAVIDALQFLRFTKEIVFVTNADTHSITPNFIDLLKQYTIPFIDEKIVDVHETQGVINSVKLESQTLPVDKIFSEQGSVPNSELAKNLGVSTDEKGYILADNEQRTNIPFVYAAGDITKEFSHQIVTAAHEGSMAGQSVNFDLYEDFLKGC